ncbi:MAG: dethiobiotin synthase [Betaproteobacteria bacterium]|nr:dethiobiotin synthase [Betaproteobacteria bacterium]
MTSPRGFFVTGTDTEVGKTLVAAALMHALRRRNRSVIGMKPVAAGGEWSNGTVRNEDVDTLRAAATVVCDDDATHPYVFREPIAPHIASEREGRPIELRTILASFATLAKRADVVVVEGAGGFLVPLNARETFADLATALGLPVVLVVGMRLGCINHALLTQEAILARGLSFAGWVANHVTKDMPVRAENVATLRERLRAPLLAEIPHSDRPDPATTRVEVPGDA